MLLVLGSAGAHAATYQVGPTRTLTQIGQAMASAGPGDVIEVDGNATYSAVRWTKSGTAAQPIRIVGMPVGGHAPADPGRHQHGRDRGRPRRGGGLRHLGRLVALLLPPRRRHHAARQRRPRLPGAGHPGRGPGLGQLPARVRRGAPLRRRRPGSSDLHGHRRGGASGQRVPDAVLLRPRRQRRQQRQVARRAQRDLLQLDRGRACTTSWS